MINPETLDTAATDNRMWTDGNTSHSAGYWLALADTLAREAGDDVWVTAFIDRDTLHVVVCELECTLADDGRTVIDYAGKTLSRIAYQLAK